MAYGNVNSPGVTVSEVAAEIAKALESYILASQKGAANGVASLDALGKVLKEQIPALEYIAKNARGTANGVTAPGPQKEKSALHYKLFEALLLFTSLQRKRHIKPLAGSW